MAYTDEQYAAAGQWIAQNLDNPQLIASKVRELGLSNDDVLRAARTVNPNISMSQVEQYVPKTAAPPPVNVNAPTIDTGSVFRGMGAANPTDALGRLLTGQVDTSTLDPVVANAQRRLGEQFGEQVLPGIRGGAMTAGQYGSSRQGIAEGLAARGLGYAMGDMSANMYNQAYQDAQNRMSSTANNMANLGFGAATANAQMGLNAQIANQGNALGYAGLNNAYNIANMNNQTQRYGIDQNYNLGMTNANNNRYATDRSYDLGSGRLDLERDTFGFNSAMNLNNYNLGLGNLALGWANSIYNQPMNYYNNFSNVANSIAGQGGVSNQTMPGNPLMGAVGGWQLGSSMFRSPNATGGANTSGWGTGSGYGNQDFATAGWFTG